VRRINELIAIMEVQRDNVAGGIVACESCDGCLRIARSIKNSVLALLRHLLSPYRKRAKLAIITLASDFTISRGKHA